jgi:membrane protein
MRSKDEEGRGRSAGADGSPGEGADRGREANRPSEIPARGWRDVALRVKDAITARHLGIIAAGVAFYGFLSLFPTLAALLSLYGLIFDPAQAESQIMGLAAVLPREVREIIAGQLAHVASQSGGALGFGFIISLALAIWTASRGVAALFEALDIAYEEQEARSLVKFTGLALAFTVGATILFAVAIGLVVVLPVALGFLGLTNVAETLVRWLRWPLLALFVMAALQVVYRYAPSRRPPKWRWVSWGSAIATVLWIVGSLGFSYYVGRFGDYNEMYGSVAAVVILLLWFFLSAFIVLLGAQINAELEHQTRKDSTVGAPKPMGQRGATVADTVGRTP